METVTEELLSMDEAIERLKTTRPTFYRWLRSGRIKGLKVGRQWRFYPADLERFLQGEGPRVDLPLSIEPLYGELGQQLEALGIEAEVQPATAASSFERMLQLAVASRASSLHLEGVYLAPGQEQAVLRCRIDGQLQTLAEFDRRLLPALIEAARQLSHGDPHGELPQEGQFYYECPAPLQTCELRTLFLMTGLGESLSANLLNRTLGNQHTLEQLALPAPVLSQVQAALKRGWGLVIASGPTGSGKTTTLHAALNQVAGPAIKTVTIEEPVERIFPWVTSLPVQSRSGQTIGSVLRSALLADPDVVMISEMRDAESLQLALRVALTGHLVLTTLHVRSALGSLLRLVEVSGNAYSVTESVSLILNQRLVRRLCAQCRRQAEPPAQLAALLSEHELSAPSVCWQAVGCEHCQAGYRGRLQLTEALELSSALSQALLAGAPEAELRRIWLSQGGQSWVAHGLERIEAGETSAEELLRAAGLG